jgi:hypothetical protein
MRISTHIHTVLAGIAFLCVSSLLMFAAGARAAQITIFLRVEGSKATLFEGPTPTEPIPNPPGISTKSSGGPHPCDLKDNGGNGGFGPAAGTPTAALYQAATASGMPFDASWSSKFNDFFVTQAGSDVNGGEPEFPSWGYAVNYTTAGVGGCQFQLAPGSEVLWAYNYFNLPHLLRLSGPASANAGIPFQVSVTDGQTGQPIPGAAIGEVTAGVTATISSSSATDANGNATVTLAHPGTIFLKATHAESVRSNGLAVCVHNGNDGTCGTTRNIVNTTTINVTNTHTTTITRSAEVAEIQGIKNGHVYYRRAAPRLLNGTVIPAGAQLRKVQISLKRRYRGRCFYFSGSRARFVGIRCGKAAPFFSVGAKSSFSYLLPSRLPRGRYVYEIEAVDGAGQTTKLVNGVSRVVFSVR